MVVPFVSEQLGLLGVVFRFRESGVDSSADVFDVEFGQQGAGGGEGRLFQRAADRWGYVAVRRWKQALQGRLIDLLVLRLGELTAKFLIKKVVTHNYNTTSL